MLHCCRVTPRVIHALAERELAGRLSYKFGFIFRIFSLGMLLVAVYYVGVLVPSQLMHGGNYFTVTVIGIGLYAFVGSISGAPRSFLTNEISMGTFETLMTLGPSIETYIFAVTAYQGFWAFIRALCIVLVPFVFGWKISLASCVLLLPLFMLSGAAAYGVGLIQAALDLRVRSAGRVFNILGGGGALLSGVYFPVALLPEPFQILSNFLPAKHAISAARAGLLENRISLMDYEALAILAALCISAGMLLLRSSIRAMKRDGTFLTY